MLKIVGIIPAHLASVRLTQKILLPIHGLPMIEHVRRRAQMCEALEEIYVATCDKEIADVVENHGGKVIMTSNQHKNGTSRVAEAIQNIECSHVVLLQGDEPLLLPEHLDLFVNAIKKEINGDAWNATGPIEHEEELDRHSFVKCATSPEHRVLYCFRRTPCYSDYRIQIKFVRKILGIIAFRKDFLKKLAFLERSVVEEAESIEQMRIIENGYILRSVPVAKSLPSVNEPHEVDIVLDFIKKDKEQSYLLDKVLNMK